MGLTALLGSYLTTSRTLSRIPPLLSLLCILVGLGWLLILPLDTYSRQTYISENAILPGQVHTYFGGSEHNVFRGYRREIEKYHSQNYTTLETAEGLRWIFDSIGGLKTGVQGYTYHAGAAGRISGHNAYARLTAPRGDATEGMVLVAPWHNGDGEFNVGGVALLLTLARYFRRWSIWSKDINFLIPSDTLAGPQAWLDAYHFTQAPGSGVENLRFKGGALQGGLVVDYPFTRQFEGLHVLYDGVNGQLPNLDLVNTAFQVAASQMGLSVSLQGMYGPGKEHSDSFADRLWTIIRGMAHQASGRATGAHSAFLPYRVEVITLQAVGHGWHDEGSMGRTVESLVRSINNLMERFHQSFFLYLLLHPFRFVSVGTYLPSALVLIAAFTASGVALWMKSGSAVAIGLITDEKSDGAELDEDPDKGIEGATSNGSAPLPRKQDTLDVAVVRSDPDTALIPQTALLPADRPVVLSFLLIAAIHSLGFIPHYALSFAPRPLLSATALTIFIASLALPHLLATGIRTILPPINAELRRLQAEADADAEKRRPWEGAEEITKAEREKAEKGIPWDAEPRADVTVEQVRGMMGTLSSMGLGMVLSSLATLNFSLGFVVALLACPLCFVHHIQGPISVASTKGGGKWRERPMLKTPLNRLKALPRHRVLKPLSWVLLTVVLHPLLLLWAATVRNTEIGFEGVLVEAAKGWHVNGVWTGLVIWIVYWPALLVGAVCLELLGDKEVGEKKASVAKSEKISAGRPAESTESQWPSSKTRTRLLTEGDSWKIRRQA